MRRMIIITSIISGLCASTIYAQSSSEFVPDAATVALWHLNGNGNDASGSENGLAVKADRISWLSGVFNQCAEMGNDPWSGSCLDSDGGALTASGSGCTYPGSGDWTVEAWVLFQSNSDRYELVSHCSEDGNGPGPYRLFIESGEVCFQLEDSNNSIMIQADISPFVGRWVHLAGVYHNGQGAELYVDGLRVACMATTLIPETLSNCNVFVGGSFCGTSTGLEIDEVRISNVARYGNPESETDSCLTAAESPDQNIPDDLIVTQDSFVPPESIIIIGTGTNLSRPRINDNGEVVWSHKDPLQDYTIYSSTRGQISDGPEDRDPDINNDGEVVWRFGNGGPGPTGNGIQSNVDGLIYLGLGQDPYYDTHRINNMGEIVYNRNLYRFGENVQEIWSNTRGRLTDSPDYTVNRRCAINDSGEVAYVSYRNPLTNNLYDIISTEDGVITNDHPCPLKRGPDINNNGEIVWYEKELGAEGVWSVWSNIRGKIGDGVEPSINDIGEIVWQGNDDQIYSNIRGQITNNNENNKRPQINNNGRITWLVNFNQIALLPETAPVANAGGPYIVEAMDWWEQVELDGSGSYDPDGDVLTYEWDLDLAVDSDEDGDPANDVDATGVNPEVLFPIGQTDISLVVTDSYGVKGGPNVTTVTVSVINVGVEIRIDDGNDTINVDSAGVVRVTFLTDLPEFDANTIDPTTVVLEGMDFADGLVKLRGKNEVPMMVDQDYDGDGDIDRVVNLDTERLTADGLDAYCEIGALTYDGYVVLGVDIAHLAPVSDGSE